MKKRIEWVDVVKYLSIMTIIIEHLEAGCDEMSVLYTPWGLEAFFLTAGYVHRAHQDRGDFFWKKVKCLIVPWLVFSFLDISLSHVVSFREHESYLSELLWNLAQIRNFHAQLWFIPAIFTAFVPFYFFVEWYEKKSAPDNAKRVFLFWLLAFGLFAADVVYSHIMENRPFMWGSSNLPWHIDYAFIAMYWMVLGYFLRQRWEPTMDKLNTCRNRMILSVIYLAVIYQPYVTSWRMPGVAAEIFARFINPTMGCILICCWSKAIKSNRYIRYIGQNTILIFAFHGKLLGFGEGILRRFAGEVYAALLSNKLSSSLFAICFSVLMSFILIIPTYIVNRYFPFLVGRKMKK